MSKYVYMKIIMIIILIAIYVFLIYVPVSNAISSSRIDSWLGRAKAAGSPQQVVVFLDNYKTELYKADRVEGKYCSIFKYPSSSIPIYIEVIDGLIVRAQDLEKQESTDTSYQMGLVNLEKDLNDLNSVAWGVWYSDGGWIWILLVSIMWLPMIVIGIILWIVLDDLDGKF